VGVVRVLDNPRCDCYNIDNKSLSFASATVSNKSPQGFLFFILQSYILYSMDNPKRAAVFIDNSNVFHHIYDIRKTDKSWVALYNPLILAQKLAGNRNLVYVGFYCVRPPSYLLNGTQEEQNRYNLTQRYYGEI